MTVAETMTTLATITPVTGRVYLTLSRLAGQDGSVSISLMALCGEAGVNDNSAHKAVQTLRDVGLISYTRKYNRKAPNTYYVTGITIV